MQISATGKDLAWNYAGTFFRMGSGFLLLPFLLYFLNGEELGMWYVFLAVSSFVTLFQSGFASTFARNVTYCWSGARKLQKRGLDRDNAERGEIDYRLLADVVAASRLLYRAIALAALLALGMGGTAYVMAISEGMREPSILPAWAVFCAAVFLNMYFTYYESLLRGVGDFPGINKAAIGSELMKIALSVGLLMAGFGLVACSVAYLAQGVLFRMMCKRSFFSREGIAGRLDVRSQSKGRAGVREVLSAVAPNAVKDSVVSVANYCVTTANTVICSIFLTLSTTGTYSVVLQLVNAAAGVAGVVLTTQQPSLQSAFARGDAVLERELSGMVCAGFVLLYVVSILGIALIVIPAVVLVRPSFECDWVLFALMATYIFLWRQHSMCAALLANANDLPYVPAFVIFSAAGVVFTVVLAVFTNLGLYSLVLGQGVAQLAYNNWKWPHEAAKRLGATYPKLLAEGVRWYSSRAAGLLRRLWSW